MAVISGSDSSEWQCFWGVVVVLWDPQVISWDRQVCVMLLIKLMPYFPSFRSFASLWLD